MLKGYVSLLFLSGICFPFNLHAGKFADIIYGKKNDEETISQAYHYASTKLKEYKEKQTRITKVNYWNNLTIITFLHRNLYSSDSLKKLQGQYEKIKLNNYNYRFAAASF